MAKLVAAVAASHGPLIVREWNSVPPDRQARLTAAFRELGKRLAAAKPEVLIIVSPDHWINFFIDNLPAICIGVGETHDGPPEAFLKDFPHKTLAGHPELAGHILRTALQNDFEPSFSHHLKLDHGFIIPFWRMELPFVPKIIPIIVNDLEPPMPSIKRCLSWGRLVAQAIESFPGDLRVAIMATGGLSHSIGEPTMGDIDEKFDLECIRLMRDGKDAPMIDYLEKILPTIGNGAHEVRNWMVVHGAAGSRGFDLIDYLAVPEVYVGCGFASWHPATLRA